MMDSGSTKPSISYFYSAFVASFLAVAAGYFIGGLAAAWIVIILAVLEISLSFDNAVVNATVLEHWDEKWRKRFINWGLPIAVFGMRLVFPIVIVAVASGLGMIEVLKLAINSPEIYAEKLSSVHHQVAAFGGAFLLMVAFKFFLDSGKEDHWIAPIEKHLTSLGQIEAIQAALVMIVIISIAYALSYEERLPFLMAGIFGLITYIVARGLGSLLGGGDSSGIVKAGIGGLLYLELLDASFSFDGVIGAFALSNELFIIALGLGVGAFFVRSLTLYLVDKGTLAEYCYLEHGAFWAILALAIIMLTSVFVEVPEIVTGFLSAGLIVAAFINSLLVKRSAIKTVP